MEAPEKRISREDFEAVIKSHIEINYERVDESRYKCKKCGVMIEQVVGYVDIHPDELAKCMITSKVSEFYLPYCPQCEGKPKNIRTCVHIPMFPNTIPLFPASAFTKPTDTSNHKG